MPLFSIITINYNDREGLERTILSVAGQSSGDYELIVIDGGSSDGSRDLLEKYKENISYSVSEKDSGVYNAQNKGIRAAKGRYCLFLNSGDTLFNESVLSEVSSAITNEDIVYGDMMIDDGNHQMKGEMPEALSFSHMIHDTLWHPVSFIRRELFDKYGIYREDLKVVADYDFFLKTVIVHKVRTKHIPLIISVFRTDGMSSDPANEQLIRAERAAVQRNYFTEDQLRAVTQTSIFNRLINKTKRWFRS